MRILSLDVGQKNIGMAVSDALGITAQPLKTLKRRDEKSDIEAICGIISGMNVSMVIIGLPINMDGTRGPMAAGIAEFAGQLEKQTPAAIQFWDERLTTMEAERLLIAADMSRKKRKKANDAIAAQLILQGYLDKKRTT